MSAGSSHTCAVAAADGSVECWGRNEYGEASAPAGIFTQVSAGRSHTCAVAAADGSVECWGFDYYGQASPPAGIFTQVSAGADHTCAVRTADGSVECWGWNGSGGATPPLGSFTTVSAGAGFTCAVAAADSSVVCWGYDAWGQASPPSGSFSTVSAGHNQACAVAAADGTVHCWGDPGPASGIVSPPSGSFTQVSAGAGHNCAVAAADGAVECWGQDDLWGQSTAFAGTFTQVAVGPDWVEYPGSVSGLYPGSVCVVAAADGSVKCWGYGLDGQTLPPSGSFTQVSTGRSHTCGVAAADGSVECWGYGLYDQATPPAGSFTQVSAGLDHTCALSAVDGTAVCWGSQTYAPSVSFTQVSAGYEYACGLAAADGSVVCWGLVTADLEPPLGSFTQVSAGGAHACGLMAADGSLECWGDDSHGQASAPAGSFTQVSAGTDHTCAIAAADGSLECWGNDTFGQASAPAGVFTHVSARGSTSCALAVGGTLECWGLIQALSPAGATPTGTGVAVSPPDETTGDPSGVTLTFDQVDGSGETTVSTSGTGAPPREGFRLGHPPVYYEITTTATYSGSVEICIDYSGQEFANEQNLRIFHDNGNGWEDVTSDHDSENDIICGIVTSLSPFVLASENTAPVANPGGPYTGDEGSPIVLSFSGSDGDGDALTYAWDLGDGTTGSGDTPPTSHTYADNGAYPITLTASDAYGGSHTATTTATILNVAPSVGPITAPLDPVPVGTTVSISAPFSDPGTLDTHTVVVDWDADGGGLFAGTTSASAGTATASYIYAAPGVYALELTVTDDDGGVGTSRFESVVVYDPTAGFVTGGGWIDSPPGAYALDVSLKGKATFGFVSRYKNGASVPSGNTEFRFHAGDFAFSSSAYEFLVITQAGTNAQYKGSGWVNGGGAPNGEAYRFMLWAGDGEVDTFRIRIWWEDATGVETVVYDNGVDQRIGGGSIVIHSK